MSDQDRLIEHSYDGIQEYDNPMPRWWVTMFWATIVYSGLYLLNIGGMGSGEGRIAEFEASVAAAAAAVPPEAPSSSPEALLAMAGDPARVSAGADHYVKYCASCHAEDGGGLIGPNLADNAWLRGGAIEDVHRTIAEGVLAKGMPAWGQILKPSEVDDVTAYVWSLGGTIPAAPKAPEGEVVVR